MAGFSVNDWQAIQSRNEIHRIHKTITSNKAMDWSIFIELLMVVIAFCLDNIYREENSIRIIWILISLLTIIVPSLLLGITYIKKAVRSIRLKQIKDPHEIISRFDDEVCYYIMTATAFFDSFLSCYSSNSFCCSSSAKNTEPSFSCLSTIHRKEELLRFYYIETSYYLNKSVDIMCLMNNNLDNLIEKPQELGKSYGQKISYFRFSNVINIITSVYTDLEELTNEIPSLQISSPHTNNLIYINRLNDLIRRSNRAFNKNLSIVNTFNQ